jgi:hypothetical protein
MMTDAELLAALPVKRVDPVLYLPLWTGSLRDVSGNGNTIAVSGAPYWGEHRAGRDAVRFSLTAYLTAVAPALSATATAYSVIAFGDIIRRSAARAYYLYKVAGQTAYFNIEPGGASVRTYDGVISSSLIADLHGSRSAGVTLASGEAPTFYADGVAVGVGNNTQVVSFQTGEDWRLFGRGADSFTNPAAGLLFYLDKLTPEEVLALSQYGEQLGTPRKQWPGLGLSLPGREVNNLEAPSDAGSWTTENSGVIADAEDGITVTYGGVGSAGASQAILTPGKRARFTGEMRTDGIVDARIDDKVAVFYTLAATTDFTAFDFTATPQSADAVFRMIGGGAGNWVQVRNLRVLDHPPQYAPHDGDALYLDNLQTARVSLADETSGQLSNTGYKITSGTWRVKEDADTGERYAECLISGVIWRREINASGIRFFELYKGALANQPGVGFLRSDKLDPLLAEGGFGYGVQMNTGALARVIFFERNPAAVNLWYTDTGYVATHGVRYKFAVTRSDAGVFTTYIKGGAFTDWTLVDPTGGLGTNPVTDTTVAESLYTSIRLYPGDRLYLDQHYAGINPPT